MSPRQNWDSPNPSLASECGGGAHSPAGEVLEESQFRRLEKKPSILPFLWCTVLEERCLRRKGGGGERSNNVIILIAPGGAASSGGASKPSSCGFVTVYR